jgi:hypothetical protein
MAVYKSRNFLDGISQPFISVIDKNTISDSLITKSFVIEGGYTAYFFGSTITINNPAVLTIVGTVYILSF